MNREAIIGWVLIFLGVNFLVARSVAGPSLPASWGVQQEWGREYVVKMEPPADAPPAAAAIERYHTTASTDSKAQFSSFRTAGLWIAAFFTIAIYSFLYRDNVFYKLAESLIVGVSAGYWCVSLFWEVLVEKCLVKATPALVRAWMSPELPAAAEGSFTTFMLSPVRRLFPNSVPSLVEGDLSFFIPVVIGLLLFARLSPRLAWLARWPVAFTVGTFAGLRLVLFLNADFYQQIAASAEPLLKFTPADADGSSTLLIVDSLKQAVLLASVLACLCYFYFSAEHKGAFGAVSRYGVWVLMITFGASFANTVMGRITLLTMRLEFLFRDWLGLLPRQ